VLARTADDETVSHFELSTPIGKWCLQGIGIRG
jgi:hypothetical protein